MATIVLPSLSGLGRTARAEVLTQFGTAGEMYLEEFYHDIADEPLPPIEPDILPIVMALEAKPRRQVSGVTKGQAAAINLIFQHALIASMDNLADQRYHSASNEVEDLEARLYPSG